MWRDDFRHVANHLATVALTVAIGVAPLVSNPARFSSVSWAPLRDSIGVGTWGAVTLAGGLLLLAAMAASTRVIRWALMFTGALHLSTAATFAVAQSNLADANPTGWILFGGLALRHAMQALWFPTGRTAP